VRPSNHRRTCLHCGRTAGGRRRGLCVTCYRLPAVRGAYPALRGTGAPATPAAGGGPAPRPTDALPGTEDKVAVLELRAEAGVSLWHARDGRQPEDWR
jgi:hypothetical protein